MMVPARELEAGRRIVVGRLTALVERADLSVEWMRLECIAETGQAIVWRLPPDAPVELADELAS